MSTPALEVNHLSKTFGSFTALDQINFHVAAGEVMGFLGPNGAGKSTTIRIALGLLKAAAGQARIFGKDAWSDTAHTHQQLAYVPGDVSLWPALTGGQCIDILTAAYSQKNAQRRQDLIERFDLDPRKKAKTYSKGNRQKVALIAALSLDVDLLILDEPTSGLDPLMENIFQECVKERAAAGTAILLSSHIMSEVQALAESITIIKNGQIVSSGKLSELQKQARTRITTHTKKPVEVSNLELHELAVCTDLHHTLTCTVDQTHLADLIGNIHQAGVVTLTVEPPSLDELFRDFYDTKNTDSRVTQDHSTAAKDAS